MAVTKRLVLQLTFVPSWNTTLNILKTIIFVKPTIANQLKVFYNQIDILFILLYEIINPRFNRGHRILLARVSDVYNFLN